MSGNKIKFKEDDLDDDFGGGSSDEELTEREQYLVKKYKAGRKQKSTDSDEEVLGFGESDSDEESDKERFENDSDIASDHDNDGIPDAKAWGKSKSSFYNTNYVDQDYSSISQREEESALQEEHEARTIQMQLAKHLKEADFSLDVFVKGKSAVQDDQPLSAKRVLSQVKADLSGLTAKQKQQLLKKDSPELKGLIAELNEKVEESYNELEPIILELETKNVPATHPICDFIRLKNQLHLTYATNITFYLLLKASQKSIKNHPILKRLVQLKELLAKLDEKYEEHIRPEVERLLEDLQSGRTISFGPKTPAVQSVQKTRKKLNVIRKIEEETGLFPDDDSEDAGDSDDDEEGRAIERKMAALLKKVKQHEAEDEEMDVDEEEADEEEEETLDKPGVKRKITYQMAKNKGLTPHRKKEQRNPRVKHREKFRKALIRRKGAVRTVRTELSRYSGEHSGIKSTVRKGIQIK